ncbi:MAG: NUDIX hydrolase [Pseudomonadota bacterium]
MDESNPWKLLHRREVYDNPWIRVDEDKVVNPAGGINQYGRIHFKNQAIGIIPLDEHGNTWLVGQYRYVPDTYSWEIPMGGSPYGEDILQSAKRELKEETGLSARRWTQFMHLHTTNSVTDEVGYVFLAEELSEGETEFEDTEVIQVKKVPLSEAVRMVIDGEITDAISAAGLLKLTLSRPV